MYSLLILLTTHKDLVSNGGVFGFFGKQGTLIAVTTDP